MTDASVYRGPAAFGMLASVVSQAALRLVGVVPVVGDPDRVEATIELRCGCVVTQRIAADRILEREGGERYAVGKYRCPEGHPAR